MKRLTKLLPIFLIGLQWACSKPTPDTTTGNSPVPPTGPYLKASVNKLVVSGNAGTLDSFLIQSNANWHITVISTTSDWVKVTPLSGTGNSNVYVTSNVDNYSGATPTATAFIYLGDNPSPYARIDLTQGKYVPVEWPDQPWKKLWSQLYGGTSNDIGYYAAATPDGGVLVVGGSYSNNGDIPTNNGGLDGVILKLSATGAKQWEKTVGGTDEDRLYGVTITPDGGSLSCGISKSPDLPGSGGAYLVRLDANGNLLWQKRIGAFAAAEAAALTPAHDGGFLVTGVTLTHDVWIAKIDDSGNILWEKHYGGSGEDIGYAVVKSAGGGYVIAATSDSNNGDVVGAHGKRDGWVLKIDNAGNIEWKKSLGGSNDDDTWDLKAVPDGYVLAGFTFSNDGDVSGLQGNGSNGWLVKLDASGNLLWQKCVDMQTSVSVAVSPDNQHYFLAGVNTVAQVDNHGNLVAQQNFGNTGIGTIMLYNIFNASATEYIATGYTSKKEGSFSSNKGGYDIWVLKFKLP